MPLAWALPAPGHLSASPRASTHLPQLPQVCAAQAGHAIRRRRLGALILIAFGLFFAFAYLLAWWARCCFTALVALALLLSISAGYFLAVGAGLLVSFMMQLREPLELVLRLQVQENTKRMQLRPHATGHWVHCKKRSKEKTRCMIANPPRECLPLLFPCYPKKEKYGRGHVCRRLSFAIVQFDENGATLLTSFSARRRAGTRCHDLQNAYRQWAMKHPGHCGMFLPASGGTCASARPPVSPGVRPHALPATLSRALFTVEGVVLSRLAPTTKTLRQIDDAMETDSLRPDVAWPVV